MKTYKMIVHSILLKEIPVKSMSYVNVGRNERIQSDLAQVIRLALAEQTEDVRLFVARLVRKYRNTDPELAEQMDLYLRAKVPRASAPMRKATPPAMPAHALPVDDESRLSLLKVFKDDARSRAALAVGRP